MSHKMYYLYYSFHGSLPE